MLLEDRGGRIVWVWLPSISAAGRMLAYEAEAMLFAARGGRYVVLVASDDRAVLLAGRGGRTG